MSDIQSRIDRAIFAYGRSVAAGQMSLFDEAKHPRNEIGEFSDKTSTDNDGSLRGNSAARQTPRNQAVITLHRASDSNEVRVGYSFAAARSDAKAYLDNPGFGGETLYRCRAAVCDVIDLTEKPWETLSEAIGEEVAPENWEHHFPSTVTASDKMCAKLAAAGYQWAKIIDDYPEGCVTYVPLTDAAANAAETAMVEA